MIRLLSVIRSNNRRESKQSLYVWLSPIVEFPQLDICNFKILLEEVLALETIVAKGAYYGVHMRYIISRLLVIVSCDVSNPEES